MNYFRKIRVSDGSEEEGVDISQLGEMAYHYVSLERDLEVVELRPRSHPIQGEEPGSNYEAS